MPSVTVQVVPVRWHAHPVGRILGALPASDQVLVIPVPLAGNVTDATPVNARFVPEPAPVTLDGNGRDLG